MQWQKNIMKAVEDSQLRRRQQHLSAGRRSERGLASPMSQFPGTPLTEHAPQGTSLYSYGSEASSPYPYMNSAQPSFPPGANANAFDDEYDDGVSYEPTESGRSTPSTMARRGGSNTRSLPAEQRELYGAAPGGSRPRAQTEDSSSAVINQWRNQTPGSSNGPPSLPRGGGASHVSNGSESHSLRSSASSRQLRSKQSSEWGGGQSPAMGCGRLPEEETTPRQGGASIGRQASHGQVPTAGYPTAPPLVRNRSASSPNIYPPGPGGFSHAIASPHLSEQEWAYQQQQQQQQQQGRHPYAQQQSTSSAAPPSASGSRQALHKSSGTNSGGTLASASSVSTNHKKRFSSSSNGTDRSSATSNQSLGQGYSAGGAGSPNTGLPPSGSLPSLPSSSSAGTAYGQPQQQGNGFARSSSSHLVNPSINHSLPPLPPVAASAVRVKVTFGEDTFVVVVLSTVTHRELVDKVLKKIRLCGRSGIEAHSLRLRYQDEDGDKILITSEEDVMMAFEAVRSMSPPGGGQPPTLIVYATVDPGANA